MKNRAKFFTTIYIIPCVAIALLFAYLMLDFFVIPTEEFVSPEQILMSTPARTEMPAGNGTKKPEETGTDDMTPEATPTPEVTENPEGGATGTPDGEATETPVYEETGTPAATPTATPTPAPTETPTPGPTEVPEVILTDNEYHNGEVDIVITKYREHHTDIYVADIKVKNAYLLRAAFAKNKFGKNIIETTSQQAKNNHAILAINGDFYGKRENGYIIRNGEVWRKTVSLRNERNTYQDLAVLQDGSFVSFDEKKTDIYEVISWAPWQVFSFGPAIIRDGEISVGANDDVLNHLASNPRTVIAQIEPLHYLFVVSDGRTAESDGLSLLEMAEFLKPLGVTEAYNFDGGGSTAMYFNGKIINKPVNSGRITERFVSDIVYIPE